MEPKTKDRLINMAIIVGSVAFGAVVFYLDFFTKAFGG